MFYAGTISIFEQIYLPQTQTKKYNYIHAKNNHIRCSRNRKTTTTGIEFCLLLCVDFWPTLSAPKLMIDLRQLSFFDFDHRQQKYTGIFYLTSHTRKRNCVFILNGIKLISVEGRSTNTSYRLNSGNHTANFIFRTPSKKNKFTFFVKKLKIFHPSPDSYNHKIARSLKPKTKKMFQKRKESFWNVHAAGNLFIDPQVTLSPDRPSNEGFPWAIFELEFFADRLSSEGFP